MSDGNSSHWSEGLLPVVYGINTRMSSTTKCTPYEVMFGQRPGSDQEFWRIVKDNGIQDEEQQPTPIEHSLDQMNLGDSNIPSTKKNYEAGAASRLKGTFI
ncbi:unnamed protein product [Didymodactylos carnosus]|uniref:Uncharacterized protein n=1 Tax=Didymodactylos carnosus TaxID=1234261 RepID=A0A8S2G3B9_9BILA|nr:unnamed protein product [Didymodactylos carnosus]CAF4439966.1 unnamed protein product [Didymodactylos carnosus]